MRKEFEIIFTLLASALGVDWCERGCKWNGEPHVRCIFKQLSSNDLCPRIRPIITPIERKFILHYHNVLRSSVAAGDETWRVGNTNFRGDSSHRTAGDMQQMTWDYGLEENARIYATQCNVQTHKTYQCAGTEEIPMVFMNKYDDTLSNTAMSNVFYEFVDKSFRPIPIYYSYPTIVRGYKPGPWVSFYAIIYSKMDKLGCTKVLCGCDQGEPIYQAVTIVCLYGPSPNFSSRGFPVFDLAPTCKSCPFRTWCKRTSAYPNLCAGPEDPEGPVNIPSIDGSSRRQQHSSEVLLVALVAVALVDDGS